jgi:hypothetical protein
MAERKRGADRRTTSPRGRTTPTGGRVPAGRPSTAQESGRYTPPIPRSQRVSPPWVPVLMFALLGLGVLTIILNYVNLLPGDASNGYLLLGLLFITGGFVVATNYH